MIRLFSAILFSIALLASSALGAEHETCCTRAKEAGKVCAHKCCAKAAKDGKTCEKCNGKKEKKS